MAVVDVFNCNGEKVSQIDLKDEIFNIPVKSHVLHEVVKMQQANKRCGIANVKHRTDVRGSTRKLYRQKGTGRARRGGIRSPLLRGGGSVFGPNTRDYSYRVPKKVRRLALKMALSNKLSENKLLILDQFDIPEIKTKMFLNVMTKLQRRNALLVTSEKNEKLELSTRNLQDTKVLQAEGLNVYDLLKYEHVVLLQPAIENIERRLL